MAEQLPNNDAFQLADIRYTEALAQFREFQKSIPTLIENSRKHDGIRSLEVVKTSDDETRVRFLGEIYAIRFRCDWDGNNTGFTLQSFRIDQTNENRYLPHRSLQVNMNRGAPLQLTGLDVYLSANVWGVLSRLLAPADTKANS